jgi:hypothetical protein
VRSRFVSSNDCSILRMSSLPASARQLVHDHLWLGFGYGLRDGARVERVGDHRLSAELAHQLALGIAPRHASDLVTTLDELRHQQPSERSGRSGYQDPHGVLLSSRRFLPPNDELERVTARRSGPVGA